MYICHLTRQIKRIYYKHYKVHMQKNYEKKKKKIQLRTSAYQTQQSNVFDFNVLFIKFLGLAPKFHKSYYRSIISLLYSENCFINSNRAYI